MNTHRIAAALSLTALASTPVTLLLTAPALAASSKLVKGPAVNMKWGPVAVTIRVSGKKVTAVSAVAPTERPRSANINAHALPILRSEVLKAQSASIHAVSGATLTSKAYDTSLAAALRSAGI